MGEYEFNVKHVPGKENLAADALSRIPEQESGIQEKEGKSVEDSSKDGTERFEEVMTPIQINAVGMEPEWSDQELARLQRVDETLSVVIRQLEQGTNKPPTSWNKHPQLRSFGRV